MKRIAIGMRALIWGVLTVGVTTTTACGSRDERAKAQNFGTLSIPLLATVGANTYRLDAVFVISGAQGDVTLTTTGDEPVVSTTLSTGSYSALLQSFTLFKEDSAGTFNPVSATVTSNPQSFTVFADSTTTVNFQFETDGSTVAIGSGNVDLTFGVTETAAPCTVLGSDCPDGFWCAPPALTGAPIACLPAGTTPIGASCMSPLECVAGATCHDFGAGPVCTALCTPDEFGQPCASGGTCVGTEASYGLCSAESCNPLTVDAAARTLRTARFYLDFSNNVGTDPEELDVLKWMGGGNYTSAAATSDACSTGEDQYLGNSWTQKDPAAGGRVLVGSGSTGTWQADGESLLIHSTSTGCPHSAGVPVETRYRFRDGLGADTIEVDRTFSFGSTPFLDAFRPFVPRLVLNFDLVLHPNADGTKLVSESMYDRFHETSDFDGSWYAITTNNGPSAGRGVIVVRKSSAFSADLAIDGDALTWTNASSAVLMPPSGGFTGDVSEEELLCFFDATSWTSEEQASLTLPAGCELDLACDAGQPVVGCESNPCQHGGTCTTGGAGGYTCQCPPTITGKNCEVAFTDVQLGQGFTCGLRNDRRIVCWGAGFGGTGVPDGTFQALSAGGLAACALRTDGTIACWGFSDTGALNSPAGSFETIVTNSDYSCATHDQIPTCWGALDGYGAAPNDRFSLIKLGNQDSCGIRPDGTVGCWDRLLYNDGQANPPAGTFSALSLASLESCGIRQSDSKLECWGATEFGGAPLPSAALQAVDINDDFGCGLDLDGHILCWGTDYPTPPAGSFTAIAMDGSRLCAIGTDDLLTCWGPDGFDYGTPPY